MPSPSCFVFPYEVQCAQVRISIACFLTIHIFQKHAQITIRKVNTSLESMQGALCLASVKGKG